VIIIIMDMIADDAADGMDGMIGMDGNRGMHALQCRPCMQAATMTRLHLAVKVFQ
jgi:hypothetical protein